MQPGWRRLPGRIALLPPLDYRKSGSHRTPRWREQDSNPRSPVRRTTFSRRSRPISDGGDSRAEPCRDGFIARPDVPALLREAHKRGCAIDLADVTYYVGHETVVPADDEKALPRWVEALVAFMQRNSAHLTDYFKLPIDAVVEIGREISI